MRAANGPETAMLSQPCATLTTPCLERNTRQY
jgi:hypothetical protein